MESVTELSCSVESKLWGPCQNWLSHFYLEQYFNEVIGPGLEGFHPSCKEDGVFWVTACPLTAVWKGPEKFHVKWQSGANRKLIRCRHIVGQSRFMTVNYHRGWCAEERHKEMSSSIEVSPWKPSPIGKSQRRVSLTEHLWHFPGEY